MGRPDGFERLPRRWRWHIEQLEANLEKARREVGQMLGTAAVSEVALADRGQRMEDRNLPAGSTVIFRLDPSSEYGNVEAKVRAATVRPDGEVGGRPLRWLEIRKIHGAYLVVHPECANLVRVR